LEARSKDRVIRFDEQLFNQYAATPDRPYHLAFFCTAESMLGSSKLKLQDLRREFTLVAEVRGCAVQLPALQQQQEQLQHTHCGPITSATAQAA